MAKILVTGAAGFIGATLVETLLREGGHKLVLIDDFARGRKDDLWDDISKNSDVVFMQGDLTDHDFVRTIPHDFELVFHFAAVIGVKSVSNHPDRVLYVNTVSTLLLLEHFKNDAIKPKRFVFSSTSEMVAGTQKTFGIPVPTPETVPICLSDMKEARSTYLLSKALGESACFTYQSIYGIPCTVVRYFNVYGPRMGFQHVVPELFIRMTEQSSVEIYSPDHTRAFCYVDDAVSATLACARSDMAAGELINIGNSGQEIAMRDLAKTIADVIDARCELKDGKETPGSPVRRCPDTSHLKALTGFQASVSLKEGIKKTYEWYKPRLGQRYE